MLLRRNPTARCPCRHSNLYRQFARYTTKASLKTRLTPMTSTIEPTVVLLNLSHISSFSIPVLSGLSEFQIFTTTSVSTELHYYSQHKDYRSQYSDVGSPPSKPLRLNDRLTSLTSDHSEKGQTQVTSFCHVD